MPNQSAAANVHPFMRIFPAPQPPDASDPVPAMRREITLLRIELEQLRAMEDEARKTMEFLFAHVDRIMESRDQWQREAEHLRALMAQAPYRIFVAASGLMSYGTDLVELYRQGASYVDRILRGAKPADLPVQTPTKYETILNLKTAKALGLQIPDKLLALADEVID
jgi:FtsZ-binding cell division protein ZapB